MQLSRTKLAARSRPMQVLIWGVYTDGKAFLQDAQKEELGELTIPDFEQMRDLPLTRRQSEPPREVLDRAQLVGLAEMYFDPHSNTSLPTWMYTPDSHTLASSLPSVPTLEQFARMNQERRLNVILKMTSLLTDWPKPDLNVEGKRLKGMCDRHPVLRPAQRLIYGEIMKRLERAMPYWDSMIQSIESFKAFQANSPALVQPQALEAPGSNPLKPQPRRKASNKVRIS